MQRWLEVAAVVATFAVLVATSRSPEPCASETVTLHAATTCGPEGDLTLTSTRSCSVTTSGADRVGLPDRGFLSAGFADAGVVPGELVLSQTLDAGSFRCTTRPRASGLAVDCARSLPLDDGGFEATDCSGTLMPR